jgi:hypothetical protein
LHPEVDINEDWGDQLKQILEHLEIDGYIKYTPPKTSYFQNLKGDRIGNMPVIRQKEQYNVTFKWSFFYSKNGYQGELERENNVAFRQATEDLHNNNEYIRNKYQFWVTVSIGVSTAVSAVYYILEIRKNHFDFYRLIYPFVVTALLALIPTATIILLLSSNQKKQQ